ncbi:MAG: phosphate ABC transporter permease subunit PstC [Armatimonadetes bacterium]|nr:phosphate ABC transporter permease subunit PstC [Armatimonadota bacterium]
MQTPDSARRSLARIREWAMERIILLCGAMTITIVVLIFAFLLRDGLPTFRHVTVPDFLLGRDWYPLSDKFQILPLILGSLLVTAGAILIAVPIGIASAVYLAEVAPLRVREVLKPTVEVLAGIPSVVIGFIGMVVLGPYIKSIFDLPTGLTALTGSVMLAFMAMPTIISISEDAIVAVPRDYGAGALALGATPWQAISGVTVPAAKSGIIAAVMLGIGRAIGETMTVLMVTGNAAVIPHSFLQPVRTMTATIAAEMGEVAQGTPHYYSLFAIGIVLFGMTFLINLTADLALQRSGRSS